MNYRFHTAVILIASSVVFITDFFATKTYLYWYLWWFDILMHFVAGIIVGYFGMFVVTIFFVEKFYASNRKKLQLFWGALVASLVVGIIWEILEYAMGLSQYTPGFVFDTVTDLINDVTGGILTWALASRLFIKRETEVQ